MAIAVRSLHSRLRFDAREVVRALRVLERHRASLAPGQTEGGGSLSVAFLSDSDLARLHGAYLSDPSPTDVITFVGQPEFGSAGEICVSVDAAVRAARRRNAFSRELFLYLAHGWLHLAGHDDRQPAKRRAMRRAEARAIRAVRAARAMPRFTLAFARRSR